MALGALARTAKVTLPSWSINWKQLTDNEFVAIGQHHKEEYWGTHWDAPAMAALLRFTYHEFDPRYRPKLYGKRYFFVKLADALHEGVDEGDEDI
jgi:hypothetical protein